jgi:hypothetical protein
MKSTKPLSAVICVVLATFLSLNIGRLEARDANGTSGNLARAQSSKQQCVNTCRARYRDCRGLKQLPSSECRGVYQDCTRYTCTGAGPG